MTCLTACSLVANGRLHVVESQPLPPDSAHRFCMAFAICNMLAI